MGFDRGLIFGDRGVFNIELNFNFLFFFSLVIYKDDFDEMVICKICG